MNKDQATQHGNTQMLARATRALAGTFQAGLLATGLIFGASLAYGQAPAPSTNDTELQSAVTAALAGDAQLRGQQVTASVAQGVVTLNGSVQDDALRVAAEQTVAQVNGVKSINDGLAVSAQTSPAPETGVSTPPQDGNVADNRQPPLTGNSIPAASTPAQSANMPPAPPVDSVPPQQQGAAQYPQQNGQYAPQSGQYQGQYAPQNGQYPGQYAPQNGQYPGQPGQYAPPPQPYVAGVAPEKQNTSGPVTMTPGLLLNVRTSEPLSTGQLKAGQFVQFTAASDVYANGVVAIPRGAVLTGQVIEAKNAGPFGGSPKLDLKLTTIALGSQTYPLSSDVWSSQGPSKSGYTAANTLGGAAFGALIGAVAGGGIGAGVGAVAGGTGGALISGATHGPRLDLPAEALLQFHLAAPLTVQPVSYGEAERLAASVPQQPVLRQRPMYVRAPYPYYPRPYPAPYYYRAY